MSESAYRKMPLYFVQIVEIEMRRAIGGALVAAGLILVAISIYQAALKGSAVYGSVLLIGPIPVVFGSSPEMAMLSMLLAFGLMAFSFLLFRG
jgi:uncharacterized protein (TIGR00304 family)